MNHILYLSSANLPTNPRVLKEIDSLSVDYKISVILYKLGNWSDSIDEQFRASRPHIDFILLDATIGNSKISWFCWAILEKIASWIWPLFKESLWLSALASSRRSVQLYCKIRKLKLCPDLIVSHHNLNTLYPSFRMFKLRKIPFVYDAEDFDPGVEIANDSDNEIIRRKFLLRMMLPSAHGVTSASPLIGEATMQLIHDHQNHLVVLNSFSKNEFQPPLKRKDGIIKFVWFSQKISFGRGLEHFFKALEALPQPDVKFELHLIGEMDSKFETGYLVDILNNKQLGLWFKLIHKASIPQLELHQQLSNYDIGLALEYSCADLNRQLCLTNKIIAYTQAGLYILATDTPAQKQFIAEDNARGVICEQNTPSMCRAIAQIVENRKVIAQLKQSRYEKGDLLAWENEVLKVKYMVDGIVSKRH